MGDRINLDEQRVRRLAAAFERTLRATPGHRYMVVDVDDGDADLWRRAARAAGRRMGWRTRTGVTDDGRLWMADIRRDDELTDAERADVARARQQSKQRMRTWNLLAP